MLRTPRPPCGTHFQLTGSIVNEFTPYVKGSGVQAARVRGQEERSSRVCSTSCRAGGGGAGWVCSAFLGGGWGVRRGRAARRAESPLCFVPGQMTLVGCPGGDLFQGRRERGRPGGRGRPGRFLRNRALFHFFGGRRCGGGWVFWAAERPGVPMFPRRGGVWNVKQNTRAMSKCTEINWNIRKYVGINANMSKSG